MSYILDHFGMLFGILFNSHNYIANYPISYFENIKNLFRIKLERGVLLLFFLLKFAKNYF